MLTYMEVHLYYTIPPTVILFLLTRPLLSSFDRLKIGLLCTLALAYTTPWDNYIIYHKAWWYRKDAVLGTIGYVPVEEYFFFIIQTIFTSLWTTMCSRWTIHSLHLRPPSKGKLFILRYVTPAVMATIMVVGWMHAIPAQKTFYLGSITWWVMLVLIVIWFLAGTYIYERIRLLSMVVLVPSVYLCYVDVIALRARVWHISEATSLEVFLVNDLPLEEIVFFFMTNVVVALGATSCDRVKAVIDTYFQDPFPVGSVVSIQDRFKSYLETMLNGSLSIDHDPQVIDDLELCIEVLDEASKSFSLAANLFPNDVKQDLTILYAFCRVTDDMVDNEISVEQKRHQVEIITKFLDQLFSGRRVTGLYKWESDHKISKSPIDWEYFENNLDEKQLASFRSIARISYYLPQEPFYELVQGYIWDIDQRTVRNEDDLLEYSKYVASSVATLCTFVFCHKTYQWPDNFGPKCKSMLENARKMGLVLQICNISRDIIIDSETLGRCYVPANYLSNDELSILVNQRKANSIPNKRLKYYAEKMLDIADQLASDATFAINMLPTECQRAVLGALEIYQGIGKTIRANPIYERRTVLGKWAKLQIILQCMYTAKIEPLHKKMI